MTPRQEQELALLRRHWPDLDHVEVDGRCWVRLRSYPVPPGWTSTSTEVLFWIPEQTAIQPYGFYVPRTLLINTGDSTAVPTSHYTREATGVPAEFEGEWALFSWSPLNGWRTDDEIEKGDNMTHFVKSFRDRLDDPS
jgi:hypothetical protein